MNKVTKFFKTRFNAKKESFRLESYSRKHDILYKRHGGEKVLFVVMWIIFVCFAISFIFPFLWILVN